MHQSVEDGGGHGVIAEVFTRLTLILRLIQALSRRTSAMDERFFSVTTIKAQSMTNPITYRGKEYSRHPLSEIFPLATDEEFQLLKDSIKSTGLLYPIKITGPNEDQVFDGWNRLRACQELSFDASFETIDVDTNLYEATIALNIARRHLQAGQKALIAGQLATMTRGGIRVQIQIPANNVDQSLKLDFDPMVDAPIAPDGSSGNIFPAESPPLSLAQTSAMLGISRATAAKGKLIANSGNDELIAGVKSGELSLDDAASIARIAREDQAAHIKKRLAEGKSGQTEDRKAISFAKKLATYLKKSKPLPHGVTPAQAQSATGVIANELYASISVLRLIDLNDRSLVSDMSLGLLREPVKELAKLLESARSSPQP